MSLCQIQCLDDIFWPILQEIDRVLRNGGRYVCISLLQQHILEKIVSDFSQRSYMVRIIRCHEAELNAKEKDESCLPVFIVVATKFSKLPQPVSQLHEIINVHNKHGWYTISIDFGSCFGRGTIATNSHPYERRIGERRQIGPGSSSSLPIPQQRRLVPSGRNVPGLVPTKQRQAPIHDFPSGQASQQKVETKLRLLHRSARKVMYEERFYKCNMSLL